MLYLNHAKPVGKRYVLNFFADTIEDLKQAPTNTPFIARNGTNYGVPLDTSVVAVVEDGVKVNYVLRDGEYIAADKGTELNITYGNVAPVDTNKLWIKADKPVTLNLAKNTKNDFVKYSNKEDIEGLMDSWGELKSGAVCNDHLYIFGGNRGGSESLNSIVDYDIANNTVSMLSATLPAPLFGIACSTVGDKIYLFGGCSQEYGLLPDVECVNTIQEFDTITKTITTLSTTLKNKVVYTTAVAVGNDIYLFGGCDNIDGSVKFFDTIQKFDTITKTITTLPIVLNKPAAAVIAGLIGEKIYLLSGTQDADITGSILNTIQIFDTTTGSITLLPQTTIGIFTFCYGVIGTKIIIATGDVEEGPENRVFSFDTVTLETNQVGEYSDFEEGMGGAVYKNVLYGFGGYQITGNKIVKFTWTFPLNSNDVFIQETLDKNLFDLMSEPTKTEIGVQNVYKGNSNNEAEFVDAYLHNGEDWVNVNTGEKLDNK